MYLIKYYVIASVAIMYIVYNSLYLLPKRNKLVYIILDGFRFDYIHKEPSRNLTGFRSLWQNGVRAQYMNSLFPSVRSSGMATLATGLWAESHGIVGDYFFDPQHGDLFDVNDPSSVAKQKWWTSEPIWITATKAKLKTGVLQWPPCAVPFEGSVVPLHCETKTSVEGADVLRENLKETIHMLDQGFDFIQVFDSYIDEVNHLSGPDSERRKEAVRDIDVALALFMEGLRDEEMDQEVNVVVVGTHGSSRSDPESVDRVEIDPFLEDEGVINVAGGGAFVSVSVKRGFLQKVYSKLESMPGVEVYLHDAIPDHLHFKHNKYVHHILVMARKGTHILRSRSPLQIPLRDDTIIDYGTNGFDPIVDHDMRTIFFATGPDFKNGYEIPPIEIVDVYPLITHLLQLDPNPNNGTFDNINMVLRNALMNNSLVYNSPEYFYSSEEYELGVEIYEQYANIQDIQSSNIDLSDYNINVLNSTETEINVDHDYIHSQIYDDENQIPNSTYSNNSEDSTDTYYVPNNNQINQSQITTNSTIHPSQIIPVSNISVTENSNSSFVNSSNYLSNENHTIESLAIPSSEFINQSTTSLSTDDSTIEPIDKFTQGLPLSDNTQDPINSTKKSSLDYYLNGSVVVDYSVMDPDDGNGIKQNFTLTENPYDNSNETTTNRPNSSFDLVDQPNQDSVVADQNQNANKGKTYRAATYSSILCLFVSLIMR